MWNVEQMITTPRWHEPHYWKACEECGAWVSSELFGPEGTGEHGCFCSRSAAQPLCRSRGAEQGRNLVDEFATSADDGDAFTLESAGRHEALQSIVHVLH